MKSAEINNFFYDDRRAWQVIAGIAALHILLAILAKYGVPEFHKKKSEITIEIGAVMPRGNGGSGIPQVPVAERVETQKSTVQDDLSTQRQLDNKQIVPTPPRAGSSSSAGVQSAPTVDADYKASYLNNPKPPYPMAAFKMKIEGTVMLKALVNPDGSCGEVMLAKTSGNELLDKSALSTVAQWRFVPAKSQGKEISQWVNIPITFVLKKR
jgi:protein TonB